MKNLKITVKIKSHVVANASSRFNAIRDLTRKTVRDFEELEENLLAQGAPIQLAKTQFSYDELILEENGNGEFPVPLDGIACLSKEQIESLHDKNIIMLGIRGKIY